MAADGHTKRRILVRSMRYGLRTQPALLVRGSSRRIMTLRFRPAYIRVINRRYLSTAATCSAFQNKTGWIFLCRGRSSPEEQPIQNPSNQGFYSWLDKSLHIRTVHAGGLGTLPAILQKAGHALNDFADVPRLLFIFAESNEADIEPGFLKRLLEAVTK